MSIKNKFATAVATASLLAGLFGSAFVPSAMAVIYDPTDTVAARYTTLVEEPGLHQAGTEKSFGFQTADANEDEGAVDVAIGINLFKAASTQFDFTATKNQGVQLKATSSSSSILLAWAYDDSGAEDTCADTTVEDNLATSSTFVNVAAADMDNTSTDGADMFYLCFSAKRDTTAATSTITVTVGGTVATTFSVTAVGPIASLTASITGGYKYLAEDNDYLNEWLTVIAKDSAGVQINGSAKSVSNEEIYVADWIDQPENQQGDQISLFNGAAGTLSSMDGDTIGIGTAEIGYDVNSNVCTSASTSADEDGDAGKSYSLKVEDYNNEDVVSNAITITCTLDREGARVTAVVPEATSGADLYNETALGSDDLISLNATVVDANGAPLGDGAGYLSSPEGLNFGWEFDGNSADLNYHHVAGQDATSGVLLFATLAPDTSRFGRFTYTLTATDSDLNVSNVEGDDAVEKAFKLTYTAINAADPVTISKKRNAAKTSAVFTADMGEDSAFDTVYFTVEKKNGNVVEYARRANATGIAKLTLNRRNTTIYVYASYDADTDVIKCVFK